MKKVCIKDVIRFELCNGGEINLLRVTHRLLTNISSRFIFLFRIGIFFREKKVKFLPGLIRRHIFYKYGCLVSFNAEVGIGLKVPHPNGIVIGEHVRIGNNCIIYQQVTIGGKVVGDAQKRNYPRIENDVVIFAGAKLVGNIKVGEHSIIGANSVVNRDVPAYSVVAGVPAKILKESKV